jgi:hypothetical protein
MESGFLNNQCYSLKVFDDSEPPGPVGMKGSPLKLRRVLNKTDPHGNVVELLFGG